jgi:hypothetical protein
MNLRRRSVRGTQKIFIKLENIFEIDREFDVKHPARSPLSPDPGSATEPVSFLPNPIGNSMAVGPTSAPHHLPPGSASVKPLCNDQPINDVGQCGGRWRGCTPVRLQGSRQWLILAADGVVALLGAYKAADSGGS